MSEDLVAMINRSGIGTLSERLGIQITEARPGHVAASMPVAGNTQPYGLLHGGASAALAETVGSIAADIHSGPQRAIVGIELNCTHHRAARQGQVHAVATPLHEGNTLASYSITVTDDDGRLVSTCRLTCLVRPVG